MTGVLHTEQSLASLLAQGRHECWTVRVRDVFGDYGLVGVLLFETADASLRVDTFLLSCRALGRRVEDRMVENLRTWALGRGVERLIVPVVPTARNRPALEFLNQLCGAPAGAVEPFECVLSAAGSASEWRPAVAAPAEAPIPSAPAAALPVLTDEEDTMVRIANDLHTAAAVVSAVRTKTKRRQASAGLMVAPRNAIEASLARIWSECLGIEPVGVRDNFFDFGGHSLIATRILARACTEFGVELSLATLFEAPTVEGMAAWIADASLRTSEMPVPVN